MQAITELIDRRQISDQQFLFSETDLTSGKNTDNASGLFSIENLKQKFPKILIEAAFYDTAMSFLKKSQAFSAMAIRMDTDAVQQISRSDDLLMDFAEIMDTLCADASGIWGMGDDSSIGCFFKGKDANQSIVLYQKLRKSLAHAYAESVSAGIAVYPTLSYHHQDILENAEKALNHALLLGPGRCVAFDAISLNISGDQYYQAGDIDKAMYEYHMALKIDSKNVNVHNSLGVCYGIREDLDNALLEFTAAVRLAPNEHIVLYNTGYVYFLKKEYATALEYFQKADQMDDGVFETAFQTGSVFLELNQLEDAKQYFEKALALNSRSAAAYRLLGDVYAKMDRILDAETAYKEALKRNPKNADALSALGYLYEVQGKNAEIALVFCRHGIEIDPENGLFRYRLGRLLLNRKRIAEALDEFQKAQDLGYSSDEDILETFCRITAA